MTAPNENATESDTTVEAPAPVAVPALGFDEQTQKFLLARKLASQPVTVVETTLARGDGFEARRRREELPVLAVQRGNEPMDSGLLDRRRSL